MKKKCWVEFSSELQSTKHVNRQSKQIYLTIFQHQRTCQLSSDLSQFSNVSTSLNFFELALSLSFFELTLCWLRSIQATRCRETKSHFSMTHETALIRSHLEFIKILVTIDRGFSSMTQLHFQSSWKHWLSFIKISRAELLSCIFRIHENISYYW